MAFWKQQNFVLGSQRTSGCLTNGHLHTVFEILYFAVKDDRLTKTINCKVLYFAVRKKK